MDVFGDACACGAKSQTTRMFPAHYITLNSSKLDVSDVLWFNFFNTAMLAAGATLLLYTLDVCDVCAFCLDTHLIIIPIDTNTALRAAVWHLSSRRRVCFCFDLSCFYICYTENVNIAIHSQCIGHVRLRLIAAKWIPNSATRIT